MNRSRWLALLAISLVLLTVAVTSTPAQFGRGGGCPFTAQVQMNVNMRFQQQPPMMMPPMMQHQPRMQMPMMQHPNMPNMMMNRPQQPHMMMPHAPQMAMQRPPAMQMRVPTLNMRLAQTPSTQLQRIQTLHRTTVHMPIPQMNLNMMHRTPGYGIGRGPGFGVGARPSLTAQLTLGVKRLPLTLTTMRTTMNRTTVNRPSMNLSLGNRIVRMPTLTTPNRLQPNRPALAAGPRPLMMNPPNRVVGNGPLNRVPTPPVRPQPVQRPALPQFSVNARLNMQCGGCHGCSHQAQANAPNLIAMRFPPPAPRPPVLPIMPRPIAPMMPPALVTGPRQPLMIPFVPPVVYLPQQRINPLVIVGNQPIRPVLPTDFVVAPRIPINPMRPALLHALPPPDTTTNTLTVPSSPGMNPETPTVLVDLKPPTLPTSPEPTRLQAIPSVTELIIPADPKPAPASPATTARSTARRPQGPALIDLLTQAPLLPSGLPVIALEPPPTPLDEPPVLPTLAELLQLPPALPSSPGTE